MQSDSGLDVLLGLHGQRVIDEIIAEREKRG